MDMEPRERYHFDDFTEDNYRSILQTACRKGEFCSYKKILDGKASGRDIIWRHDIDCSVHRALKMAEIEAESGVRAVYFVLADSTFYNMLEKDSLRRLIQIKDLGHEIGIHIDCCEPADHGAEEMLTQQLLFYKELYEKLFHQEVQSFSFHCPTDRILKIFYKDQYAGLYNAYSENIRRKVSYCSDSDGYWRYQRLEDFLQREDKYPICVLTHPVWWTPQVMSPAERIERALEGRKQNAKKNYENILQGAQRYLVN